MLIKIKIALRIPNTKRPDRHFSFRLQDGVYNEPSIYPASNNLFVISGIEGDFDAFYHLLKEYKVIDRYFNWAFGEGRLVVLGNCFNKVEPTTECLWFLYSLEHKAKKEGGYVHFILGNHEIMHINGDWRNTHPPYALASSKTRVPVTALYNANQELRRWLGTKNIIEKIGNLLFMHDSVYPAISHHECSIIDINHLARSFYNSLTKTSLNKVSETHFAWDEIPFQNPQFGKAKEEEVASILSRFNVDTLIIGQPPLDAPSPSFCNQIIYVGINNTMNNLGSLLIKDGIFYRISGQGRKEKI